VAASVEILKTKSGLNSKQHMLFYLIIYLFFKNNKFNYAASSLRLLNAMLVHIFQLSIELFVELFLLNFQLIN